MIMSMEKDILDKYRKAGRIGAEVLAEAGKMVVPGTKLIDIANRVDKLIMEKGAEAAFPVNISLNENAAHYTPPFNDETTIKEEDIVKIDIGAHIDGYIGDTASTFSPQKNQLIDAVNKALDAAIKTVRPGIRVSDIGAAVEDAAKDHGVGLIVNLTGHGLGRFEFHAQPSIPNTRNESSHVLKDGDAIAIEPFTCPTNGFVKEAGSGSEIFQYVMDRPVRLTEARRILQTARDQYHGLPFAKRWLFEKFSPVKVSMAIHQLESVGALQAYPVLREVEGKPIAQAEHTLIVADKPIVTTMMSSE